MRIFDRFAHRLWTLRAQGLHALFCLTLLFIFAVSAAWATSGADVLIKEADLTSSAGTRHVTLPHSLETIDFAPEGSRVVYRSTFSLKEVPLSALGFYVPKMSVSGNLYINDQFVGSCLPGRLEEVRCINKPQLFEVSPGILKSGDNTLAFEIYASHHQKMGSPLSPTAMSPAFTTGCTVPKNGCGLICRLA